MRRHKLAASLVAGFCFGSVHAVDPDDFAFGWPLELNAEGDFYDILLRAEVYRHGRSVEQMAVLDANGEPMPFYRVVVEPEPATESLVTLDVSPVYQTQSGELIDGLTVAASEERVNLTFGVPAEDRAQIVAFVADARELQTTPVATDLRWSAIDQPFLTTVTISHSEDLARWNAVGTGSIASLAIDDTQVRHSRIPLDGRTGGYYRIDWPDNTPAPWVLDQIDLVFSAAPNPTPVELVVLEPLDGSTDAVENALFFDAGGQLPVRAVELEFVNPNTWANAAIHTSDSLDGPWGQVSSRRIFYRVGFDGDQVRAPAVSMPGRGARYWRVLPDRALDRGDIELRLHYPLEYVRFSASGDAPYQLVAGSLSTEAGPDRVLRQVWEQLGGAMVVTRAQLGTMSELGGEAVYAPPREFPWRSVMLWGAMSLGALTVGWMAFRLGREAFY